jgi:hypothetical protein
MLAASQRLGILEAPLRQPRRNVPVEEFRIDPEGERRQIVRVRVVCARGSDGEWRAALGAIADKLRRVFGKLQNVSHD